MDWVLMSERELQRGEILSSVHSSRMIVKAVAVLLAVSRRQAFRLLVRNRADGAGWLRPAFGGRASSGSDFISGAVGANILANWLRSMLASIAGLRIADSPTICRSSSTNPPVG